MKRAGPTGGKRGYGGGSRSRIGGTGSRVQGDCIDPEGDSSAWLLVRSKNPGAHGLRQSISRSWHRSLPCRSLSCLAAARAHGGLAAPADRAAARTGGEDLVADLDRDIDRHVTILQTLISSRSLAGEGLCRLPRPCDPQPPRQGRRHPDRPEGRQLVNTFVPFGQAPRMTGSPEMLEAVRRTHRPVVSNLFTGLASREVVFNVAVPILEGDQLRYVLSLALRPAVFRPLLMDRDYRRNGTRRSGTATG